MTGTTFNLLLRFIEGNNGQHKHIKGRVADYGGTLKIGGDHVMKALRSRGIKDYHMLDYDTGIDLLKPIKGPKFDAGICMDLFEHTTNPFKIAENIQNSLKRGALLFVTAPFIWEVHNYPGDYFRFTTQGLQILFPKMKTMEINMIRDQMPDEAMPRMRVFGTFKKK